MVLLIEFYLYTLLLLLFYVRKKRQYVTTHSHMTLFKMEEKHNTADYSLEKSRLEHLKTGISEYFDFTLQSKCLFIHIYVLIY